MCDGVDVIAVIVVYEDASSLVADECQMARLIVAHGTHLVVHRLVAFWHQQLALDSVLLNLQLLQSSAVGRLPYHTIFHFQLGTYRIRQVPRVAGVVVEVLHHVSLAVKVSVATMIHTYPHNTHRLVELSTSAGELRTQHALVEVLYDASFRIEVVGTVA